MNDVLFDSFVIRIDHLYSQIPLYTYDFTADYICFSILPLYTKHSMLQNKLQEITFKQPSFSQIKTNFVHFRNIKVITFFITFKNYYPIINYSKYNNN